MYYLYYNLMKQKGKIPHKRVNRAPSPTNKSIIPNIGKTVQETRKGLKLKYAKTDSSTLVTALQNSADQNNETRNNAYPPYFREAEHK